MAEDEQIKGARVLSVFGPFASRALVEMSTTAAEELVGGSIPQAAPMYVIDGVLADLAEIAERDEAVAGSALGGTALQLAYEIANPYNSATSKAMCAKALGETLDRLRELAPPKPQEDDIERARQRRAARLAGKSAAGATPPTS